jgi:hypothetical protein
VRLSGLLSKHSADAANIQKWNGVSYFNLCATVWKVRVFEGTPAIRNSGRGGATGQERWQIRKKKIGIEFKSGIGLGGFL